MSAVASVSTVLARIATIERRLDSIAAVPATSTLLPSPSPASPSPASLSSASASASASGATYAGFDAVLQQVELAATEPRATYATSSGDGGAMAPLAAAAAGRSDASDRVNPSVPYAGAFDGAGERYGIPPRLLAAVAKVESGYRSDAVSTAGAVGLMQLMPATAQGLGVDPYDPISSIDGAARLLRDLRDRFGSIELALGAYNVGPGTISRAGGIAAGSQAERYVNAVLGALEATP